MKSKITKISLLSGLILILVLWSVSYGNRGLKSISAAEAESIYGGGYQCVHNSTCDDDVCENNDEPSCSGNGHYQIASSAEYCTTGGTACSCTYSSGNCYKKKTCRWQSAGSGSCMGCSPSSTVKATVTCSAP